MGSQHSRPTSSGSRVVEGSEEEPSSSSSSSKPLLFLPCDDDWPYIWAIRTFTVLDWRKACPTPDLLQQVALEQLHLPVEITPRFYLSDAASIANIERLQDLGVTHVLNVASRTTLPPTTLRSLQAAGIEYGHISTKDETEYPLLSEHWSEIYDYLYARRHQVTVVHCHAGQNRAALVAAAYYMVSEQETVLSAVRWLRRQRGNNCLLNHGFQEQLVALARSLNLLGPPPGSPGSIVKDRAPPRTEAFVRPKIPIDDDEEESHPGWKSRWNEMRSMSVRRKMNPGH